MTCACTACQAIRKEEANESQSMADFLKDLVSMTLTDKVRRRESPNRS